MLYYVVAPNNLANRARRYLKMGKRRTIVLKSKDRYVSMDRIIFQNVYDALQFGRVLRTIELPQANPVLGTIIDYDPSPAYQGYQSTYLRNFVKRVPRTVFYA